MSDYMIRGMAADNQVRFFACNSTETVEKARITHNTSPVVTCALGRLLTGGVLMGAMGKNDTDMLTIRIQCQGPIKGMLVTADSKGNVKGYVNEAEVMLPATDVAKAIDLGVMSVIRDIGLKEPYVGQTHLVSSEIAEDLTYYFATSDQIPSSVALGVLLNSDTTVKYAGGFIIQLLPTADEETISAVERCIEGIPAVTSMITDGLTPEQICKKVLPEFELEVLDESNPEYKCNCSRERVMKALISVGEKELRDMQNDEITQVNCQFCGKSYDFTSQEIKDLADKASTK